jgi:TP901 family phage tail tape measure protein
MGTIRIDFGSKGGSRAIADLERFNAALEKTVKVSDGLKSQSSVFSNLADGSEVDRLTAELKKLGDQSIETAAAGDKLTALGIAIKTKLVDIAVEALQSLVSAIGQTFGDAFEVFGEFDQARAAAATLTDDVGLLVSELEGAQSRLKGQVSTNELLAASYDVLSSGFTDAADAALIAEQASKASIAGFSDTETAVDALTTILNSYNLTAQDSAAIVDQLVKTQDLGKITVDEYAQSIGKLSSIASTAGVGFDELNAAIAGATFAGVAPETAISGVRQAILNLLKPTSEATELLAEFGIENSAAALKTEGLAGVLRQLSAQDITTEQLSKIFTDVDALTAIAPIAGANIERFNFQLAELGNSTGAADKNINILADTLPGLLRQFEVLREEGLRQFGAVLEPVATALLQFGLAIAQAAQESGLGLNVIAEAGQRLQAAIASNPELIQRLGEALALLVQQLAQLSANTIDEFISVLTENPEAIQNFIQQISQSASSILNLINGVVAATGAIASLYASITNSPAFDFLISQINGALSIIQGFVLAINGIADAFDAVLDRVTPVLNAIQARIKGLADQLAKLNPVGNINIPGIPSLRSGGTLQPGVITQVHKDEYIVPGKTGGTVISQARSRAIAQAAELQAQRNAGGQLAELQTMRKEIQQLNKLVASSRSVTAPANYTLISPTPQQDALNLEMARIRGMARRRGF